MLNRKLLVIYLIVLCVIASCKKKGNDNPFGNSKIATVSVTEGGATELYTITYDASNNVDSMQITGSGTSAGLHGVTRFSYFGSSYSITDQSNNTMTIYATTTGLILKVLIPDTISFIYNGSELGEMNVWMPTPGIYPYYKILSTNYTWAGGDMLRDSMGAGMQVYTYDYDNTKYGQPGDAWRIGEFLLYGRSYIKTTHLPVDMMAGGTWAEKYFYQFDGSGRISQFTKVVNNNGISADDTTVYSYTYY